MALMFSDLALAGPSTLLHLGRDFLDPHFVADLLVAARAAALSLEANTVPGSPGSMRPECPSRGSFEHIRCWQKAGLKSYVADAKVCDRCLSSTNARQPFDYSI
jgi:hypothetical protein